MAKSQMMSRVQNFTRTQRNAGKTGLALLEITIDHMFAKGSDWTPLAWLIAKTDERDSAILRKIAGVCLGGVTMRKDTEQPSGLRIVKGDNAGVTEKMAILRDLVKAGESFRGKAVSEALFDKAAPDFDLHKYVKTVLKRLENNHVTLKDMLIEIGKVQKEESTIDVTKPESADAKVKAA